MLSSNSWHTITQLVSLNDPPLANGLLYLYLDDRLVLSHTDILWRTSSNVTLDSVLFSTFFGGGDDSYNSPVSPKATSYFRRFEVHSLALSSPLTSPSRSRAPSLTLTPPRAGLREPQRLELARAAHRPPDLGRPVPTFAPPRTLHLALVGLCSVSRCTRVAAAALGDVVSLCLGESRKREVREAERTSERGKPQPRARGPCDTRRAFESSREAETGQI